MAYKVNQQVPGRSSRLFHFAGPPLEEAPDLAIDDVGAVIDVKEIQGVLFGESEEIWSEQILPEASSCVSKGLRSRKVR